MERIFSPPCYPKQGPIHPPTSPTNFTKMCRLQMVIDKGSYLNKLQWQRWLESLYTAAHILAAFSSPSLILYLYALSLGKICSWYCAARTPVPYNGTIWGVDGWREYQSAAGHRRVDIIGNGPCNEPARINSYALHSSKSQEGDS